jgi:hypothetical protein
MRLKIHHRDGQLTQQNASSIFNNDRAASYAASTDNEGIMDYFSCASRVPAASLQRIPSNWTLTSFSNCTVS